MMAAAKGRLFLSLCCVILLTVAARSTADEQQGATTNGKPLSVADVVYMESARSFTISPDGAWTAWVKSTSNKKENRRQNHLFLSSLAEDISVQLTRGKDDAYSPAFSPDGKFLAFLRSAQKSKPQIHIYNMSGGEPERLTNTKNGVNAFAWRNDSLLIFTAREDSTFRETQLAEKKDDVIIVADQMHYPPVRLFSASRKTKTIKRLTTNSGAITEFKVSPDGGWVVTSENQDVNYSYDYRERPKQFLMNLDLNERWEIFTEPYVDPRDFAWDSESRGFYCSRDVATDSTDTYVGMRELFYYDLAKSRLTKVPLEWDLGLGYFYGVMKKGVVVALADGTRYRVVSAERKGKSYKIRELSSPTGKNISPLSASRHTSTFIYSVSNASSVPEIMTADIKGGSLKNERKLIDLNEGLKKKSLPRTEVIKWKGAKDDDVEGILYYPVGWKEGKQYPLIVSLHGGPSGADRDFFTERWSNYPNLLAGKGSFVLKVNYHGSSSYGLEWVESIKGHYYEYEVPDILDGVDRLIADGLVDEGKLGIMGWSNGSILGIAVCLEDQRFKAFCAGAGDVNWISDYGNCAFGAAFDNAYLGGPPWDNVDIYIDKSPLFRMKEMKTPTLIMFGTRDTNVPTEQGWQHFRAMQQIGSTPVRFLLFPGQPHGLRKLSYQRRKMEEELAWFDRYLFETYEEKNEAFDTNSPLALELRKSKTEKSEYLYGKRSDGVLVPETIEFRGMNIGRFEVTRAQYRQFETGYNYPPGTGNHPATNIPFERAAAYCKWLSEKTGRNFRLPTAEEMKKLLKAANPNFAFENNLEYWAGYMATPDDSELLTGKISELEKSRLLVEEVGSFRPIGDEGIYDLGGNVAEWATDSEGMGEILGLSAVSSRDDRSVYSPPPLRYVGFRVLEE